MSRYWSEGSDTPIRRCALMAAAEGELYYKSGELTAEDEEEFAEPVNNAKRE